MTKTLYHMDVEVIKENLLSYLFQGLFAIMAMQEKYKMMHQDLHASNIMFVETPINQNYFRYEWKGKTLITRATPWTLKIMDFGYAAKFSHPQIHSLELFAGTKVTYTSFESYYDMRYLINTFIKHCYGKRNEDKSDDLHPYTDDGLIMTEHSKYDADKAIISGIRLYFDGLVRKRGGAHPAFYDFDSDSTTYCVFPCRVKDEFADDVLLNFVRSFFHEDHPEVLLRTYFSGVNEFDWPGMLHHYADHKELPEILDWFVPMLRCTERCESPFTKLMGRVD
jgi:hypothetical protein